ncbi:hypothetical protein BDK51DRAFT_40416 [Blyttiomyces helicus]|uniref:Uncharacterized protein n=1 Tax=Blyttiomyces helicus TaxID=388810 RepID=A0A4P9WG41_9FUNG|nr:hypothetical protein BDK51DRAFT_40416 [Blyttiomyces helicus]|eukprot:RKO89416.1 hypothetical protein BDK51DRAFT_40416 [Blyttiomyces helicus]
MERKTLCVTFGVPLSTLHCVLANAEMAPQSALKVLPDAQIRWPSFEQQREWACLTHAEEPLLEEAMYNGETSLGREGLGDKKAEDRWWYLSLDHLSLCLQTDSIRLSSPVSCAMGSMGRSSGTCTTALACWPLILLAVRLKLPPIQKSGQLRESFPAETGKWSADPFSTEVFVSVRNNP